jgi:fused signal recognition particle receptor
MIALWIVIGVVVLVLLVLSTTLVPRRRRALREGPKGKSSAAPSATATIAAPSKTTGTDLLEPPARPPERTPDVAGASVGEVGDVEEVQERGREPEQQPAAIAEEAPSPPELRDRLGRTRGLLSGYVRSLRSRGSVDEEAWEELEEALLRADVGVATTTSLIKDLRSRVRRGELRGPDAVLKALREDLRATLGELDGAPIEGMLAADGQDGQRGPLSESPEKAVEVWLFVGVNGVGKTTTIGKVARKQLASGRSVILAAGDTFRAAATEQLATWGERAGVEVVRGGQGADPSAVVYDAVRRAAARGSDLVLADTAGRLHTKVNLVEELKKIRRVADRPPGHVTEVLLVLDATTGQNGLTQAREFLSAVGVTGVVLTKLDGTAKGGIVVAIQRELGLPVKLVGVGEGADDLVSFDPTEFVDALFD